MNEIKKTDAMLKKILPAVKLVPNTVYVPSQYVLSFEHGGKKYIFNNLTKQLLEGSLPSSAMAGEEYDELIKNLFLVPEDKDECTYYYSVSSVMRVFSKKKGIPSYTIQPTLSCNARCIYCYEEGFKQVSMTPETVEQTIRYIVDTHEGNKAKLIWFGGEPLLRTEIIDQISNGVRDAGLEYTSRIVSNGSLITPENVKKMTEDWHVKQVQISMDGAEDDYIARKVYYHYRNDYQTVMKGISLMSEAGINVSIRVNVDEGNWEGIPQFLDDLKEGIHHKDHVSVYLSPLFDVRGGNDDLAMWEKIRDARPLIEQAGFRHSYLINLRTNFPVNRCMADGGSVLITPEGNIYACEHCPENARFGDIWNGITDEAARKEFCRTDIIREKCRTCPFLPDCTAFASCPIEDTHCREVREMMVIEGLKQLVDNRKKEEGDAEDESIDC